jgi:four helix bundle protein
MEQREGTTQGYRSLEIYRRSHALAVEVHRATLAELPKFEMFEQGSQIRRSSKSIVANIVEGYGRRRYRTDYTRFLVVALASCDETVAHLKLLADTGSLSAPRAEALLREYDILGRQLNSFIASVIREHQAP